MALHSLIAVVAQASESRVALDIPLHEIEMNAPFNLGSFEIEMVALNHSTLIPQPRHSY